MRTIGLTTGAQLEVISAYCAPNQRINAVAAEPGWYVVGSFFMPATADARLEVLGVLSDPALVLKSRLFNITVPGPVGGSTVEIDGALIDTRVTSGVVKLTGNRLYQIQVEVIGASGFGILKTATLI